MIFISTIPHGWCVAYNFIGSSEFNCYRTWREDVTTRSTQIYSLIRTYARRELNRYHSYWPNNFNVIGFPRSFSLLMFLYLFHRARTFGCWVQVCARGTFINFYFYLYLVAVICLWHLCASTTHVFRLCVEPFWSIKSTLCFYSMSLCSCMCAAEIYSIREPTCWREWGRLGRKFCVYADVRKEFLLHLFDWLQLHQNLIRHRFHFHFVSSTNLRAEQRERKKMIKLN